MVRSPFITLIVMQFPASARNLIRSMRPAGQLVDLLRGRADPLVSVEPRPNFSPVLVANEVQSDNYGDEGEGESAGHADHQIGGGALTAVCSSCSTTHPEASERIPRA